MKRSDYKPLGKYIEPRNERNVDAKYGVNELRGVNSDGKICESKANVIGVEFNSYKIAYKGDFIYNPARLDIGSISCLEDDLCIVSQMYVVFHVKDEYHNTLMPEYLWLWFKRPDFFRYVGFINFGSVREMFSYEDMCNVTLPIPSIEEQHRIVAKYQTVERRIKNNEVFIQKLEKTAQAIYHHTFVEGIDENNLPDGWRITKLSNFVSFKVGGDRPSVFSELRNPKCMIPIYSNGLDNEGLYGFTEKATVKQNSITLSARGVNVGYCFLRRHPYSGIVRLVSVIPYSEESLFYLYYNFKLRKLQGDGSAQPQITVPQLENEDIIVPPDEILQLHYRYTKVIYDNIDVIKSENQHLRNLQPLLTSKLA